VILLTGLLFWPLSVLGQDAPRILDIEVQGTSELEEAQLLFSIESQVNTPLDRSRIREDLRIIYDTGLFTDVRAEVEPLAEGYLLRYVVQERPRLLSVRLEGIYLLDRDEVLDEISLRARDIYDPLKVQADEEWIRNKYRLEGYATVRVLHRVEKVSETEYRLTYVAQEQPRVYLTDLTINGTTVFSEIDLKRYMISAEIDCFNWINDSGIFQEERVNQDLAVITQKYLQDGYIRVFIDKPDVTIFHNPEYSRVEVVMDIAEGDQYFTGQVEVSGDLIEEPEKLLEQLELRQGDVYNPFLQNRDRAQLDEIYQERGYAFVRVIPRTQIHEDNKTVDVNYRIIRGEKAYIGQISVAGNTETRDHVIRREFEVNEAELFNGKKLRLSQENLSKLGFFEPGLRLERLRRPEEDNVLDLMARLKETQTGTFQAQIGYSDVSGFTGGLSLTKGNLFGNGQTLRLSAQFSEQDVTNEYSVTLIEPRLFSTQVSSSVQFSHRRLSDNTDLERGSLRENSYGTSFGAPVYWRDLRLSVSWNAVDRLYDNGDYDIFKRSVAPTLTYNTVNHPVFPSEGIKTSLTLVQTGTPFGGNVELREYIAAYQQFWALNEPQTLIFMAKARLGWLEKIGDARIPPEDRYRIGGLNTVRGHNYYAIAGPFGGRERIRNQEVTSFINELGLTQTEIVDERTRDLSFDELQQLQSGGVSERVFNVELLFPLSRDERSFIRGVVFYDAGNVNAEPEQYELLGEKEPSFLDLRRSTGGGVRLITPMGVLRFEYGIKLDTRPGESPDRFDFSISGLF
jgi:outer membrane protein insertion porin family